MAFFESVLSGLSASVLAAGVLSLLKSVRLFNSIRENYLSFLLIILGTFGVVFGFSMAMIRPAEIEQEIKIFEGEWTLLSAGEKERFSHTLGTIPMMGQVWFRNPRKPDEVWLMDAIYDVNGGYGSFLTNVTDTHFTINAGRYSSTSSYGANNIHYSLFDEDGKPYSNNSQPRELRVVLVGIDK